MNERQGKDYWKSLAEGDGVRRSARSAEAEFAETPLQISPGPDRRGFLKAAGFTFAGAWLAGCRQAPVRKAIPQLAQPEGFIPGRANYYASTCAGCAAGCGVLAKTRDGRPIKLEGNPEHPVSRGGLCAAGQASILGLYDSLRFRQPLGGGKQTTWAAVDRELGARLEALQRGGGAVRFLTGTVISPTIRSAIADFLGRFRDARHIEYDVLSCSAILDAHERTHGVRALPRYRFDRAEVIVSFDADFLGTWISPVEFTAGYMAGRNPEAGRFSWHAQIEPRLSLTGSKADRRFVRKPGEAAALLFELAAQIDKGPAGGDAAVLAGRLLKARGRSLVVCGLQDAAAQEACNRINQLLDNYGATLDLERPSLQRRGSDRETEALLREAASGKVAALLVWGANPVYDLPGGEALRGVPLIVSFAERMDETAAASHYVCPDRHALESWGDAEPVSGTLSLFQPVIQPLGGTRPLVESLAAWSGSPKPAYEILRDSWRERIFPRQSAEADFEKFWERAVHDGYAVVEPGRMSVRNQVLPFQPPRQAASPGQFDLVLYAKPGMPDGRHAYNPWLQELPDPITKVTWDNYASLAPAAASRLGVAQGDVIRLDVQGKELSLPVVVQPGQHEEVVAVALGYGSKCSERFAKLSRWWLGGASSVGDNGLVGQNAAPMLEFASGVLRYTRSGVAVARTDRKHPIASTQEHHTLSVPKHLAPPSGEVRPIVREVALADLGKLPPPSRGPELELWPPDHVYSGRRWAMVVDLNACTGCSACVVACQVENNVPVVGKDEVSRNREMHWMRIDRYYSEAGGSVEVAHQPMMCQQCEHAPCETVCPVLATVHSEEGLNQQVYNRCVGTRYCANNCPYKARRFNWFEYAREDKLANMVLNPDVTVRSRGVMEKCTFCVQRIQEAKIEAKRRGERLRDGEIQTACQQSCPAKAITFGDLNDPKSRVSLLARAKRRYRVLEEINVRPSVAYLRVVRNRPAEDKGEHHG